MKNIILCDIDGTVANNDHRQHFLEGKKDWDGFFSELSNDMPIIPIINLVNREHANGNEIVFLTGRPERYRYSTTLWLKEHFDFEFRLLMRKDNDKRNKIISKQEVLFENNISKKNIFKVFENDYQLISYWTEKGFSVEDVNKII
tara:strand:+ start:1137 stop:1571 length:435 start_codon:yes stop_codon:yes gene_type:complete